MLIWMDGPRRCFECSSSLCVSSYETLQPQTPHHPVTVNFSSSLLKPHDIAYLCFVWYDVALALYMCRYVGFYTVLCHTVLYRPPRGLPAGRKK